MGATQGQWGLTSIAVFVPLALAGVLVGMGAGRLALPPREWARPAVSTPRDVEPAPAPSSVQPAPDPFAQVDYLAALRHEFRTPLNAVLGFSDVLLGELDGKVSDSQREDLEIIRASGMKLRVLLDGALDLSQLATGELKPDSEPVDARAVVERAAEEATQLWAGKRVARAITPDGPCTVAADGARLRRSILVLADFLAMENRDSSVAIQLGSSGDHITFSVSAEPSGTLTLEALPTPSEVLAAEDPLQIRRWPVAVTSELIAVQGGALYHGDDPARFVIRLPSEVE